MNDEQMEILKRLYELKEQGALTEEEFSREKNKILSEDSAPQPKTFTNNEIKNNIQTHENKSLWEHFKTCVTEKYACFEGRAKRKEFWGFTLFEVIFIFGFAIIAETTNKEEANILLGLFFLAFFLAISIPDLAVSVRRLHDINLPGWIVIPLFIIPWISFLLSIITFVIFTIIGCLPSYPKRNKYDNASDNTEKESSVWFWFSIFSIVILGLFLLIIFSIIAES